MDRGLKRNAAHIRWDRRNSFPSQNLPLVTGDEKQEMKKSPLRSEES